MRCAAAVPLGGAPTCEFCGSGPLSQNCAMAATDLLYLRDAYLTEFDAVVVILYGSSGLDEAHVEQLIEIAAGE